MKNLKRISLSIVNLIFVIILCQGQPIPFYPCINTDIPMENNDPQVLDPNANAEFIIDDCNYGPITIFSFLKDGEMYPACENDPFGNLQISFGFLNDNPNPVGYRVCIEIVNIQEIIGYSNFQNINQTGNIFCGDIDMSNFELYDQTCASINIKYTAWLNGGSPGPADGIIDIVISDIATGNECFHENLNTAAFLPDDNADWLNVDKSDVLLSGLINSQWLHIKENASLIIDIPNLNFEPYGIVLDENASIIIPENNSVTINNVEIFGCPDGWNTIEVSESAILNVIDESKISDALSGFTLHPNSTLNITNSFLMKNQIGVTSEGETNISISDSELSNNNIGLKITGNANINLLERNTFDENSMGIWVSDATNILNLKGSSGNENIFTNSTYGINLFNASAEIHHNHFAKNIYSIKNFNSSFVDIRHNDIGYNVWGIHSSNTPMLRVFNNTIGTLDNFGIFGITTNSSSGTIRDNDIRASRNGAWIKNSSGIGVVVDTNTVSLIGTTNSENSAIRFSFSDGSIQENTIVLNNGVTGIQLENTEFGKILNNDISLLNSSQTLTSGIYSNNNSSPLIKHNIVTGNFTNGIRLVNSTLTDLYCNQLSSSNIGIIIKSNSPFHTIQTNSINSTILDLLTFSELGVQEHHGNLWYGGKVHAAGLTASEIDNSTFEVDSTFDPTLPITPSSSFPPALFKQDYTGSMLSCVGTPGPGVIPITGSNSPNPGNICNYLNNILSIENSDPNAYWIKAYRLFSYYHSSVQYANWEPCLQAWWNNPNGNCGLKTIIESLGNIKNDLKGSNAQLTKVTELKQAIENGSSESQIISLIQSLQTLSAIDRTNLNNQLTLEKNQIEQIPCSHPSKELWTSTLSLVYKRLLEQPFNSSETGILESTAALCSSEFGDPVHWARMLLAETDDTRYDLSDDCLTVEPREMSYSPENDKSTSNVEIKIYPNPTDYFLTIDNLGNQQDLRLEVIDVNERIIKTIDVSNQTTTNLNTSKFSNGLYILRILNNQTLLKQVKFVVHHP